MNNIVLGISYKGTNYYGWQGKNKKYFIQYHIELSLNKVANHKINTFCAGRTDRGVHAIGQVINFFSFANRSLKSWILGTNRYLPKDIRVIWARYAERNYNARFAAISRQYRYLIDQNKVMLPIFFGKITHYPYELDRKLMNDSSKCLIGEKDFSSFRSSQCQSKTSIRKINYINIWQKKKIIGIDISANSFLHHMVRNIVGTLLIIGQKKKPIEWMKIVLKKKNRKYAGITAPPAGLYLISVNYPDKYNFPKLSNFTMEDFYELV